MKEDILQMLFELELYNIANKIGLVTKTIKQLSYSEIINILNFIDEESIKGEKQKEIIAVCAILNEYYAEKFEGISSVIERILSRIGYYPSTKVLLGNNRNSLLSYLQIENNNNKFLVQISNKEFVLTKFQKKIWDKLNNSKKVIAISAPTSAGKSFIITLKLIQIIKENNYDIIYVVPTISLVNQVMLDFRERVNEFDLKKYKVVNSYNEEEDFEFGKIYVLTQEKLMQAFTNYKKQFSRDLIFVVDEIQNIEKISNDNEIRSKVLLDSINEIKDRDNIKKIIISGPRIDSINKLGDNIFGKNTTMKLETKETPVLNITYSIDKKEKKFYFKQYNSINNKINSIEVENTKILKSFDKIIYNDDYYSYLHYMIKKLGEKSKNIIFAPTSKESRNIARELSEKYEIKKINDDVKIYELINYYKETVNKEYLLSNVLEKNIAYHNGKMPRHVRNTIEYAIKNEMINNVVCTTTLMQGVNLPAQNIIIRNPHLYTKSNYKAELSSYDMANLRGRAGRLLKDFIGRTFVYNEDEFEKIPEEYNEDFIFSDSSKKLSGDYSEIFDEHNEEIINCLNCNLEEKSEYGFIVTYIRQMILKHNELALDKLRNVGININKEEFSLINYSLKKIEVPINICLQNRYIDPLLLNKIYKDNNFKELVINSPNEKTSSTKFRKLLKYIRDNEEFKDLFKKYIPIRYSRGISLSILCSKTVEWAKGLKLSEILSKITDPNNIDDEIELLESTISYNITSLLKPIYDMFLPESSFLNNIELGGCNPIIMYLIKIGVARETAIWLYDNYLKGKNIKETSIDEDIKKIILEEKSKFPFWIKIQLDFIG